MEGIFPVIAFSIVVGGLMALAALSTYLWKRKSEIQSIARPDVIEQKLQSGHKPQATKKAQYKSHSHSHVADKHGDAVPGLCFSTDACSLATELTYQLEVTQQQVAFTDDESSVIVASQALSGSSLYMYEKENTKSTAEHKQQTKLPLPEIKWEHHKVHDKRAIITLVGTKASYGTADGSTVLASCSEGTDTILWHGKTGKALRNVDTNQLKNTMDTISPNGRFIAAAAFTADVKIWEIVYSKDGSVKEVMRAMQLKGHKSAVTWLCFSPNSEKIITTSKDGSLRIWNINGDITGIAWAPVPVPLSIFFTCLYELLKMRTFLQHQPNCEITLTIPNQINSRRSSLLTTTNTVTNILKFSVSSLRVTNFTVTNTSLTGKWDASVSISNTNQDMSLQFHVAAASIVYEDTVLGVTTLPPFQAVEMERSNLNFTLTAEQKTMDQNLQGWVLPALNQDHHDGAVIFSPRLALRANFSSDESVF